MEFLFPTQIKFINFCMTYPSYQSNLYSDIQDETAYNRQLKQQPYHMEESAFLANKSPYYHKKIYRQFPYDEHTRLHALSYIFSSYLKISFRPVFISP